MNDTCKYYWNNIIYMKIFILSLVISLNDIAMSYQPESVKKNAQLIAFTLIIVWFATRFCNATSFQCQIDVFTVFFLFWQLIFLIYKWRCQELPWFSFTLHQALLNICVAFISYAAYDMVLRYLQLRYKIALLWFLAVRDW